MSLRRKTLLLISLILAGLIGVLGVSLSIILLRSYVQLEEKNARRNVQRVREALKEEINILNLSAQDWAGWDDMYNFIENNNSSFRKANLEYGSLSKLNINHFLLFNNQKKIVFSQGLDLENNQEISISSSFLQKLKANSILLNHSTPRNYIKGNIVGFTKLSCQIAPAELVRLLNDVFSRFDRLLEKYQLEKIKTIGDCYMVVGGLPVKRSDHAETIAEMALDMQVEINKFNQENNQQLQMRIGINTGSVVAGVIGLKKFIYDLWGDAVNTASRMESHGIPEKIHVSASTYERLKDKYQFEKRGVIDVKGKGKMTTYFLKDRKVMS